MQTEIRRMWESMETLLSIRCLLMSIIFSFSETLKLEIRVKPLHQATVAIRLVGPGQWPSAHQARLYFLYLFRFFSLFVTLSKLFMSRGALQCF